MIQLKYSHSQKSHLLTGLVPGFSHFEMATGLQTTKSITNLTHDIGSQKNKKPIAKVNKLDLNLQMF